MKSEIFKGIKPTIVALVLGGLAFIAGNFFGEFMPETWLKPLAWISVVLLCLGLILATVARGLNEGSWAMNFALSLVTGGGAISLIGLLFEEMGVLNHDFIGTLFTHPSTGAMSVGLFLMGIMIWLLQFKIPCKVLAVLLSLSAGAVFIAAGLVLGTIFWCLPFSEGAVNTLCICLVSALGFVVLTLVWGVLTKRLS